MHVAENVASFFLVVYMASVVGGCGYLLGRFIMRAESLKIRARSPMLATFPAVYAILVGGILIPLQELLKLLDKGYPCRLTLVQSWLFLPVWGAPFALRSLRVVIATSKHRTEKYGFILRKRTTLVMEAFLCTVAVCIVTVLTQTLDPYDSGMGVVKGGPGGGECFMLMEWKFLLPLCILQASIFAVLGDLLRNVNDLLNISSELRFNFMLYVVFGLPYFVLQIHFRNRTSDGKFPTAFQFLIAAMVVLALINTMWASIGGLDELLEFLGWKGVSAEGSTVAPSRHDESETDAGEGKARWPNVTRDDLIRWKQHYNDIPRIMGNKRISAVLKDIASRSLCSESYDFLLRMSDYRRSTGNGAAPGLQHMLFVDICKAHVAVNSDQEINISHDQRRDILQFMNSRKFSLLTDAERASIFVEAQREVSRMLELNLLPSLHGSKAFAETCAAVDVEEHVWHLEEGKSGIVAVNPADAVASRFVNPAPAPGPARAACSSTMSRSVEGGIDGHRDGATDCTGVDSGDGGEGFTRMRGRLSRMLLLRPGLLESAAAAGAAAAVGPSHAPAQ